ncbi:MAG TPA: TolC family protein [Gemmatimonadota bacterium]|nr:TolC family protein [Gemmatimonadota bacterium]
MQHGHDRPARDDRARLRAPTAAWKIGIALGALAALVATGPAARAQEPQADTLRLGLDEAVRRATTTNEQVLIARAQQARAAGTVKEVRADALPQIDANFGYTRNIQKPVIFFNSGGQVQPITIGNDNDYSIGLTLTQTLFDFSLGPARAAARLSREATAAEVEAARTNVALSARTSYYDVLLSRALVDVQEKALEQAQRRLSQVQDFYDAGTASEFDLLTAQVEVDNLRPPLIQARNQLALNRNQLKRTVGISLDRPVALTDTFPAPADTASLQDYLVLAGRRRSDLRSQQVQVQLYHENLSSKKLSALPTLSLTAGVRRQASSNDLLPPESQFAQSTTAGLQFSVPLFDGRRRAGQVQQARAQEEEARFRLAQLQQDIRLQVQQAYQAMQAARERIQASQANVHRAERALQIAETRFKNGLSTQVELHDAELAVTQARSNRARALHDYGVARANLMAAVGER